MKFLKKHFQPICTLIAVATALASLHPAIFALIDSALKGQRTSIYAAIVSLFGTMLGFVLSAVSIISVSTALPQLRILRASGSFPKLMRCFFSAVWALAFGTAWALLALIFERDGNVNHWFFMGTVFWCALCALRTFWCIWFLHDICELAAKTPGPGVSDPTPPSSA